MAKRIKVNVYDDMRQALTDAAAYDRGEKVDLRVAELPSPPKLLKPERDSAHQRESARESSGVRTIPVREHQGSSEPTKLALPAQILRG